MEGFKINFGYTYTKREYRNHGGCNQRLNLNQQGTPLNAFETDKNLNLVTSGVIWLG